MSGETPRDRNACAEVRELVAWFATGTLDDADARRVEDHLADCAACSSLLSFTRDLKTGLTRVGESHPRAEFLVDFAESGAGLTPADRAAIERHIGECGPCADLVGILETIDKPQAGASGETLGRFRALWSALAESILKPAPAAGYLTVAAAAVVLLLTRPTGMPDKIDAQTGATRPAPIAGGVVLLPDFSATGRGVGAGDDAIPVIRAGEAGFLLLEFLEMHDVPVEDAVYRVSFIREGQAAPIWEIEVGGSVFAETLSLGIYLEADTLSPGRYEVTVTNSADGVVYRSALEVR